jgi:tetratricopeptide (TPR) repeat protein
MSRYLFFSMFILFVACQSGKKNSGTEDEIQEKYLAALIEHDAAVEAAPDDPATWFARGALRNEYGDYEKALEDLNKSVSLDSGNADALVHRSVAKYFLEDYTGAIQDCNKAALISPGMADVYYHRGLARMQLGDHQSAEEDFTHASELAPENPRIWFHRGWVRDELGNFEGAIQDYDLAISLDSKYSVAYFNRGIAKYQSGDVLQPVQTGKKPKASEILMPVVCSEEVLQIIPAYTLGLIYLLVKTICLFQK